MKKYLFLVLLFSAFGFSQNGISYQALILNPLGEQLPGQDNLHSPISNKLICLRFSILDHTNQFEYIENHKITTDAYGIVNLVIGTGERVGGYASTFSDIVWGNNPKSLKVDLDVNAICTYFVEISNQPFTYVPFAYYAANSGSANVQDATTTVKGIIRLGGDLSGVGTTANSPIISNNAIISAKIMNGAVIPIKIEPGSNNTVLVTDNTGTVAWLDSASFNSAYGAVSDMTTIEGAGTVTDPFKVKDLGIITSKIADAAVTTSKIASGGNNKVLVTDNIGNVLWSAAPVDGDTITGNEVTDAVADGGLVRSGSGTASDPYKLKINDGTANGQLLVWDGTKWVAQAAPVDGDTITGNEVTDAVADGGLVRSGSGTASDPYKLKINDGTANGQLLVWDGTKWVAQAAPVDGDTITGNEVTDAVADGGLVRSGSGTASDPYKLKINDGTANGQLLVWDGTKWVAQAAPVDGDTITGNEVTDAVADGGLVRSGSGTASDPYKLKINDGTANGQLLVWDGTKWVAQAAPVDGDTITGNEVTDAVADGGLVRSGSGTASDPYKLKINDGTANGQLLVWDGTKWVAQAAPVDGDTITGNEVTDAVADGGLVRSGSGTASDPYKLKINDGTANGQLLVWDGTKWVAQAAPVDGDTITGNEVTDAVADGGLVRSGSGTASDPYKLKINDGTANGQLLVWDGTKWVAQAAPVDGDTITGNEVTDAVADGGLVRSGSGTASDPYKLKINDGTANGQLLVWDGTKWVAQAAPVDGDTITGNEVTDAVADGGLVRSGSGTASDPYKLKINDGTANGQLLVWDGTKWVAQAAPVDGDTITGNEVTDAVADGGLVRSGSGTASDPYKLKINDGTANGQLLVWDGTKWVAQAAPVDGDTITGNEVTDAVADGGLVRSGSGTASDPYKLKINDGTANGQLLVWDGTKWVAQAAPVDGDTITGNEVTDAVADGGLVRSGSGTASDPYKLKINDGTANGQLLVWDGTKWVAQAAPVDGDTITGNEVTDAVADGGLVRSGSGTASDPYKLKINDGTANGQLLVWDGTKWVAQAAPVDGDTITGNEVTDAVADGGLVRSGSGTASDPYKLKINDGTANGQLLVWDGTKWVAQAAPVDGDTITGNEVTDAVADGGLVRSGSGTASDPYKLKINDGTANGQLLVWDGTKWVAQAAPVDGDTITGNEVTDAVADGGLVRSGSGTASDPYKLKINDGTANGQLLVWDGTKWVAQAAPVDGDTITGNEVTDAVADGGLVRSGSGTASDPYKLKINDGTANGQLLVWDGTKWVAQAAPVDGDTITGNEVTDAVADGGLVRSGSGTASDPYKLKINDGTANGQLLVWDGTKWVAQAAPVDGDTITGNEVTDAVADGGLVRSGSGTASDPYKLKINDGTANGQLLVWDGTKWVAQAAPVDGDTITGNEVTDAVADGGLVRSGSGTASDPYKLKINDGTANGQLLVWDGTKWVAQAAPVDGDTITGNEVTDAVADGGLVRSGSGTASDPYKLKINDGTANGQLLVWDGTKWVAQAAPVDGDTITGNEVTDAVANGGLVRSGSGTASDPYKLKINDGTANGQLLVWDGTKWVAQAAPVDGDTITGNEVTDAVADGGLVRSGSGTASDPYKLKINDGTANGQLLVWDGTKWVAQAAPVDGDTITGNEVTDAVADGGLVRSGSGTASDPYKLKINDGTANGQLLVWDGTKWVAQAAPVDGDTITGNEVTDAVADGGLVRSGSGTASDPYKLKINDGTANGQLLVWDGTKWVAQAAPVDWTLTGNAGTNPSTNFIGTTDAKDLAFRTNNTEIMRIASNGNIGIGVTNPSSKLVVTGALALPLSEINSNIILTDSNAVVSVNTSGGDITITLPAASTATNRIYSVIKSDASSNKIIFSSTITAIGYTFTQANIPGEYKIQSNGTNWILVN